MKSASRRNGCAIASFLVRWVRQLVAAAERHQIDVDEYKDIADHVIGADNAGFDSGEFVVETYRIIRRGRAMRCRGSNIAPINSTLHVY